MLNCHSLKASCISLAFYIAIVIIYCAPNTRDYNLNDEIFIWLMVSETLVHSSLCHRFWTHGEEEQCHAGRMYEGVVSLMVDQKPQE